MSGLGTFFLVMLGFGIAIYGTKFLIDLAWDRKGKLLRAIEAVNSVCLLIMIFAGVYFVIVGAEALWNESQIALAAVAGATIYSVYFHLLKHPPSSRGQ